MKLKNFTCFFNLRYLLTMGTSELLSLLILSTSQVKSNNLKINPHELSVISDQPYPLIAFY